MYSLKRDVSLKELTTMRVGGTCARFAVARDRGSLIEALNLPAPHFVLGKGSNVIASDRGYDGTVISYRGDTVKVTGETVCAEAGVGLPWLCRVCFGESLSGLEWAVGIPGTLGGAIRMNAGAFGGCIADSVVSVEALIGGKLEVLSADECGFSYRNSRFERGDVILGATLKVARGDAGRIAALQASYAKRRKDTQPRGLSAGSVFKACPEGAAGLFIERAGLKGYRVGGAFVSEKHANFIINDGFATACDVRCLIDVIKATTYRKCGVRLKEEIVYLGDF